jgi:hypothetical protein
MGRFPLGRFPVYPSAPVRHPACEKSCSAFWLTAPSREELKHEAREALIPQCQERSPPGSPLPLIWDARARFNRELNKVCGLARSCR